MCPRVLPFSPIQFPLFWPIQGCTQPLAASPVHTVVYREPNRHVRLLLRQKGSKTSRDPSPPERLDSWAGWGRLLQASGRPGAPGRTLLTLGKPGNSCLWFLVEMTNQNQSISLGKVKGEKKENSFPSKNGKEETRREETKIFRMAKYLEWHKKWYA